MAEPWLGAVPPEEIDAGVAVLRRWRLEDAKLLNALIVANLEHLRPWMTWAQERPSLEETENVLAGMAASWRERTDFAFAIVPAGGEPAGGMGLHTRRGRGVLEIGYWISSTYTGHGYVTACSRAATGAAFELPGVERVEIHCDEANRASAAIPARIGFDLVEVGPRQRAPAPADSGREMTWAIDREGWRRLRDGSPGP
jgi:RimJ/RimL family protein N-acetyltransferase